MFPLPKDFLTSQATDEPAGEVHLPSGSARSLLEAISRSALTASTDSTAGRVRELSVIVHSNSPQGPIIAMMTVPLADLLKEVKV